MDAAVRLVARCAHAGITINEKGGLLTRVSSDEFVRRANELQHELALSLYAVDGQHFDVDDVAVAQGLAGHLDVCEREIDQLGMAIVSRLVIGRAEGVLMERLDVTADQAFDNLRRIPAPPPASWWRSRATSHVPACSRATTERAASRHTAECR